MTPLSFEWLWSVEYYVFMGFLYLALGVVGCGLIYSFLRTWLDLRQKEDKMETPPEISYRSKYSQY